MQNAGYSGTPLAKKLGIKEGFVIRLVNPPTRYFQLFEIFPDVEQSEDASVRKDFIHFFTKEKAELSGMLNGLKEELKPNGMIWVSWPKKAAKVLTDLTEDVVRECALVIGLVDVKVCAVDAVWSGLKLVIPVKDRKKYP